ncbi:MAG: hypothetical protein E5V33_03285 [Mesorhizobium sp.]|nr:MAG: hypothetical protein E5V33_03285 [Mesorhizobium sp.]
MHTFARSLISEHPEYMDTLQLVVTLPFKRARGWHLSNISKGPENQERPGAYRPPHASGQRDYALFSLMFNTDARVQEILKLRILTFVWYRPVPPSKGAFSTTAAHR